VGIENHLKRILSHNEAVALLELIRRSLSCMDETSFRSLLESLRSLIPFDFAVCGIAGLGNIGTIDSYEIINISYPAEWLALYIAHGYHKVDPVIQEHLGSFTLQYWDDSFQKWDPPRDFIMGASDFGLNHGYAHGVRDPGGFRGSIFSFAGNSMVRDRHTEVILTHLVPHLHTALTTLIGKPKKADEVPVISPREREVLNWLKSGKTNAEMAAILGISENTIKYHLRMIMQKLGTRSRAHTVAVALSLRLIEIE